MSLATAERDLSTMLRPRSIALVGATDRSTWSKATFTNLTTRKYAGALHLVARRGGIVHGRPAATSCVALGEKIDLGLLMVPASGIEEALADLGAAGARNAVILSSGFAEIGDDGAAQQQNLAGLARRFSMSLLGPNCLGFVNFLDDVPLWTGAIRAPSRPGPIAVISQSGATGGFIVSLAQQQEIGLSHLISTGNEADLDGTAFADHLLDDDRVRAVAAQDKLLRRHRLRITWVFLGVLLTKLANSHRLSNTNVARTERHAVAASGGRVGQHSSVQRRL